MKGAACDFAAIYGNVPAINAFIIQWEEDPTLCPLDRTRDGKTSAIYTQITDPCEIAKNTMKRTNSQTNRT
jgi:hypothetical protein